MLLLLFLISPDIAEDGNHRRNTKKAAEAAFFIIYYVKSKRGIRRQGAALPEKRSVQTVREHFQKVLQRCRLHHKPQTRFV